MFGDTCGPFREQVQVHVGEPLISERFTNIVDAIWGGVVQRHLPIPGERNRDVTILLERLVKNILLDRLSAGCKVPVPPDKGPAVSLPSCFSPTGILPSSIYLRKNNPPQQIQHLVFK